ncbi:GtrA family protein [Leisingera methylohalidivorans]|uniref:Polysaccharide biosynthesis protein GtrA n=1 Tax=Leisingera methylohalidivorans DSM 14336 TaxID=999552 RepID=V9VNN8_9RHOB|nr:GtrA family protein [Leisingera methylohalidivorans]AHC99637.1 polysaccharide biosynthesis protein GtrA [Leisingera methylohalidivorans DSM 14336]
MAVFGSDAGQVLRFSVVGAAVAGLYVLGYTGLLAAGLAQASANGLAFAAAVAVQYVLQTAWTFRRPLGLPEQMARFACTIAAGFAVSMVITGVIGPALGWADWLSAAAVTVILPVQNFIIFRLWVYAAAG